MCNVDVLKKLAIDKDIIEILRTRRLFYFGHVARMNCHRYLHILLHSYVHGARAGGRPPKKKWMRQHQRRLLSLTDANRLAKDRTCQRSLIRNTKLELPERGDLSSLQGH